VFSANVFIAFAVVLFLIALTKHWGGFKSRDTYTASAPPIGELRLGQPLNLEGIDWGKSKRTLVMALSKDCKYCLQSVPVYQRLTREPRIGRDYRIVAVLPQSANEAERYLSNQGIVVDEIRQVSLVSLGVNVTPTLVLTNTAGVVTAVWPGKLDPDQESNLLAAVGVREQVLRNEVPKDPSPQLEKHPQPTPPDATNQSDIVKVPTDVVPITESELKRGISEGRPFVVIDTTNRNHFADHHYPGAKNIPLDELEIRSVNELKLSDIIVTDCDCMDDGSGKIARAVLTSVGFQKVFMLRKSKNPKSP